MRQLLGDGRPGVPGFAICSLAFGQCWKRQRAAPGPSRPLGPGRSSRTACCSLWQPLGRVAPAARRCSLIGRCLLEHAGPSAGSQTCLVEKGASSRSPADAFKGFVVQVGPTASCTVLHASGVLADALAAKQTNTGIRAVFASKARSVSCSCACHASAGTGVAVLWHRSKVMDGVWVHLHAAGGSGVFAGQGPCVRAVGAHVAVLICLCHPRQRRPSRLLGRQCRTRLRRSRPAVPGLSMAAVDATKRPPVTGCFAS